LLAALLGPVTGWRIPYVIVGVLSLALIAFAHVLPTHPAHSGIFPGWIDYLAAACLVAAPGLRLAAPIVCPNRTASPYYCSKPATGPGRPGGLARPCCRCCDLARSCSFATFRPVSMNASG
jgi:hypothetical protein